LGYGRQSHVMHQQYGHSGNVSNQISEVLVPFLYLYISLKL